MQSLLVTHVSTFNNTYLRVHGQLDPSSIKIIKSNIESLINVPKIKNTIPCLEQLAIGTFCLALNDQHFVRARIIGILPKLNQLIVHFLDYGFDRKVDIIDIRITNFPRDLEYLPVQATPYIVCGIVNDWQPFQIEEITNEILWRQVDIRFQINFAGNLFADLMWHNKTLADFIIETKGYGKSIKFDQLRTDIFQLSKQKHSMYKPNVNTNPFRGVQKNIMPVRQLYSNSHSNTTAILGAGNKPVIGCLTSFRTLVEGIQNENIRVPYTGNPLYGNFGKPRITIDNMSPPRNAVATFKSTTLMVGNTYDVECSFVDNGPCSFSVHLKSTVNDLSKMMNELESVDLQNIYEKPTTGMACIARFPVDSLCYRAIIMNIKLTGCQVSYVDYGNHEYVQYHDIFEIPQAFLEQKCFSVRFALSGYKDLEPINDNLKNMFKELVLYKTFRLKVTPLEGPPLVQYCELYDENDQNILELLKQYKNRKLTYTTNETLNKTDIVIVCYIESPKKFFVQKLKNQNLFESMMDELFLYCNKNKSPLNNFSKSTPCAVKFENAWYRAEIIEEIDNNRVTIRHIDFGNERKCDPSCLSEIAEKFTFYPPQAIQCCLKGFENLDFLTAETTITQFEMLAETSDGDRRQFKTNIFKMHTSNCYLLNLIDDTFQPELNLMKRLFKLNMPFNKYIGMEKENFNNVNNICKSTTNIDSLPNKAVDRKETSSQQMNINSETNSNGSSENICTSYGYRGGGGDAQQLRNSPQQNSNKYQQRNMRDQNSAGRFEKGIRNNLPPRFQNQKQQQRDNNRHSNDPYEKQHNNTLETSRISNQPAKSNSFNKNDESNRSNASTSDINEEYIPIDQELPKMNLNVPIREEVLICWWVSPHQFYTHQINRTNKFEEMMKEIQIFYKNKETTKLPINVGASVIARYRADNTLYRAKVLACNQSLRKYKVEFVDFGNQSTVNDNDIWLIEKRFSNEPIMAKLCTLGNIVSQFEHSYITNELEKYLKPGATVFCNYLYQDNDLYFVDIEMDSNRSLKKLLIENNLISELIPGTMLEMLVGQQIKGQITSVKDLLNFQILIEGCDVKLLCSYSDIKYVKTNSHLSSEFKRCYEGKSCSFDVIELTREKILMVQPIIPLFTKDIEPVLCNYPIISDTINVKISYVSSVNKMYAYPVSIEDVLNKLLNDLFNYYDQNGNIINEIQLGLICAANSADGNWYRAQIISNSLKTPPPNNTGTISKNDSIEVYYIDYGNTEIIDNINKLKRLDDSFLTISALAIELYLPIKSIKNNNNIITKTAITSNDEINVINRITTLTENYELQLKLLDLYEKSWIVDIRSGDNSLTNILRNEGLIEAEDDFELVKNLILLDNETRCTYIKSVTKELKEVENNKIEIVNINSIDNKKEEQQHPNKEIFTNVPDTTIQPVEVFPQRKLQQAYISHCDNPGRFFLQLASDINELEKMQDNIQIVASSLPPLMTTVPGASCITLYAVDNTWYRAKIIDSEIMAVQFTDYGNTDVDIDPENIREMNEAFAKIKSFAIPCSLAVSPKKTADWVDEANKIFLQSLENIVDFEYISMGSGGDFSKDEINYINLYIDNKNVADYLCAENLAKKLECIASGGQCFVSHLNNLSDFYLELEHDAQGLELIAEYLADYEKFPIIEKTTNNKNVGKICAAIFPDDNQWYRAKILSESLDGFQVLFIDFGNTAITHETREISEEISNVPFLSKRCSLRMPDYILGWSDESEKKFAELSAFGQQIFTVILKEPSSEYAIVDLLVDGVNLLKILEPLCDRKPENLLNISTSTEISEIINCKSNIETVTISHINTPSDFYVQFKSEIEILEKIKNSLLNEIEKDDNKLENPTNGDICAAVFLEDGALYRAEILSKDLDYYHVFFIDFGNCSDTTDVRSLSEDLLNIPPIAKKCSLLGTNLDNPIVIDKFKSIINPIINEDFGIKIIDDSQDFWIVNLSYLNQDLSEKIHEFQLSIDNSKCQNINRNLKNIVISHIISSTEFYVQFESEAEKVELISNMLTNVEKLLKITEPPKVGEIYAAIFPDDDCYYRAKIMEIKDDIIQVFFIDFGNSSKTTDLRLLPSDLKNLQNLAIKCELDHNLNKDFTNEIIENNFTVLMDSHFGEALQMDVIEKIKENENEYWKVKLFVKNSNLTNELENLIKLNSNFDENQLTTPINNVKKCTISHCNSPNDFYIQLSSDTNQLEEITKKLSQADLNFEKYPNLLPPSTTELCAAKFPDDGAFYRAKILSIKNNDYEVLYIDFGNTAITNDIRKLPDDLKLINGVGKHCALDLDDNLSDIDFLCKNTTDCMQQIINSHLNETFQVDILNDSTDPWVVKLYYQNKNFADELCNTIKDGVIRNDENIIWHDMTNNSTSASSSTIGITNDLINEISGSDQIITHEVLGNIVDNLEVNDCNTTQELAQELFNEFQEALSHPNAVEK